MIVILYNFDFKLIITNALSICTNFGKIILKRYQKLIASNPTIPFRLHNYSTDYEPIQHLLEQSIEIIFICVGLSAETLDLVKLSYPECTYKIITQNECISLYPEYFSIAINNALSNKSSPISSPTNSHTQSLITPYNTNYIDENNISIIIPDKLYLTNYIGASNLDALLSNNITHIINITDIIENYFETNTENNFTYLKIPIPDALHINITEYLKTTNKFIDNAIANGGRVLVHCFAGKSRSASIVIGYIMEKEKMAFQQALDFVLQKRPCIDPNLAFCAQLSLLNY